MWLGDRFWALVALVGLSSSLFGDVGYRGIAISDEDWGLRPWAFKHFGDREQIGVRAYREIFALMKAYGVNAIWPAMRPGGYEFVSRPANLRLAFEESIAVGSSPSEPMMRNPNYLASKEMLDFDVHPDFLKKYWDAAVTRYGSRDVLWTIGMGAAGDVRRMGGTDAEKIQKQGRIIAAQMGLLEKSWVDRKNLRPVYTLNGETLPLYDAGLRGVLPRETTVLWPDDGYGYVRRLKSPPDGLRAGVSWHASGAGLPRSYLHVATTPPAFMWWELVARAWNNGAGDAWMVDVGDVFQAEPQVAALGFFGRDPNGYGVGAQTRVLRALVENTVGYTEAPDRFTVHLAKAYTLGFIRRPEFMSVDWIRRLPPEVKRDLVARWTELLVEEDELEAVLTPAQRDRYYRLFGYTVRYLAQMGLFFAKWENYTPADEKIARADARLAIDRLNARWDALEGGRWSGFFANPATFEVQAEGAGHPRNVMLWPWYGPQADTTAYSPDEIIRWQPAGEALETKPAEDCASWREVPGLGTSGRALALLPVSPGVGEGAEAVYVVDAGPDATADTHLVLQFLPDYELVPGAGMGVRVSVNDGPPVDVRIPWCGAQVEARDYVRQFSVQDNFVRVSVNVRLNPGENRVRVLGWLPGVALDKVGVQFGGRPANPPEPPPPVAPVGLACGDCGPYTNGCTGTLQAPKVSPRGLADFGWDAFGWLEIRGKGPYTLCVGEAVQRGKVDFASAGSYAEQVSGVAGKAWSRVPMAPVACGPGAVELPAELGVIRPFRYVEAPPGCELRRMIVAWPLRSEESSFACSDPALTRVYAEARRAVIAGSYAGCYLNGDPGRKPTAGGVYLNMLGQFAVSSDSVLAARSLDRVAPNAAWTLTDRQMAILNACEHYVFTGDGEDAKARLPTLKIGKIDVKNFEAVFLAMTYRDLCALATLSAGAGMDPEVVAKYREKADFFKKLFNEKLWNTKAGVYRGAEGKDETSVFVNALAVASGLAEGPQLTRTGVWLAKQTPPADALGELFFFQALYRASQARVANVLLAAERPRGWGETAPVNLVAREVMGVKVLEPGAAKIEVRPQPGNLKWMKGSVPTVRGPVRLDLQFDGRRLSGTLATPTWTQFTWNGKTDVLEPGQHNLSR